MSCRCLELAALVAIAGGACGGSQQGKTTLLLASECDSAPRFVVHDNNRFVPPQRRVRANGVVCLKAAGSENITVHTWNGDPPTGTAFPIFGGDDPSYVVTPAWQLFTLHDDLTDDACLKMSVDPGGAQDAGSPTCADGVAPEPATERAGVNGQINVGGGKDADTDEAPAEP